MEKEIRRYAKTHKIPFPRVMNMARISSVAVLLATLASLCGCTSGNSYKPTVTGVGFTDVDGTKLTTQPTSLATSQGTYVAATLTGDTQQLGVTWVAVCGSALAQGTTLPTGETEDESCGTFTPAHTMSTPIPSYVTNAYSTGYLALYVAPAATPKQGVVTLYAEATADPSRVSTVTLSITGQPISVSFAPSPSSSLKVSASTKIKAEVNNDTTSAGVRWTTVCGSSDCGSFSPVETTSGVATTYTAPATVPTGSTVQVTATSVADPTKAISSTITITQ
jgi:hypothetical protein